MMIDESTPNWNNGNGNGNGNGDEAKRLVVVVAVDQTASSTAAIDAAAALIRTINGGEIHVVHVIPLNIVPEGAVAQSMALLVAEGRSFIDVVVGRVSASFDGRVCGHLAVGPVARRVLQLASDLQADYIVVGSAGKTWVERLMAGSVSEAIAKKARCTVIVARPTTYADESDSSVPEILPACSKCLVVQRASNGEKLWCVQHATRHAHGHLHYETPEPFAVGSTFIQSTT
jgi:nucleotide-binding universal stress UspA family protein